MCIYTLTIIFIEAAPHTVPKTRSALMSGFKDTGLCRCVPATDRPVPVLASANDHSHLPWAFTFIPPGPDTSCTGPSAGVDIDLLRGQKRR